MYTQLNDLCPEDHRLVLSLDHFICPFGQFVSEEDPTETQFFYYQIQSLATVQPSRSISLISKNVKYTIIVCSRPIENSLRLRNIRRGLISVRYCISC